MAGVTGAQRLGDTNIKGGKAVSTNFDVLVNNRPVVTLMSMVLPHPPYKPTHSTGKTTTKQYTVFVGSKPITTSLSIDTCGDIRLLGSLDVIVG